MTRAHLKASIPTLKPSSTQEPTSFIARHTKLILLQRRNITLSIKIQVAKSHTKPIDTSKLTIGHFIALQREEIQFHPQNTNASFPNQETLTSNSSKPTHREIKENKWKYLTCVAGLRDFLGSSTGIPSFPLAFSIILSFFYSFSKFY